MKNPFVWLLSQPIRFYRRFISPLTPPICRYTPSCSKYALEALEEWGAIRGTGLALWRILRCNPFGSFGPDPVPINRKKREKYKKIDPGKNKRRDIQDSDKNTTEDA